MAAGRRAGSDCRRLVTCGAPSRIGTHRTGERRAVTDTRGRAGVTRDPAGGGDAALVRSRADLGWGQFISLSLRRPSGAIPRAGAGIPGAVAELGQSDFRRVRAFAGCRPY